MSRPKLEVADIFRRHGAAWRTANKTHLSLAQRRVMTAIEICRTAALGGHVERCEDCAYTRVAYNSCLMGKLMVSQRPPVSDIRVRTDAFALHYDLI